MVRISGADDYKLEISTEKATRDDLPHSIKETIGCPRFQTRFRAPRQCCFRSTRSKRVVLVTEHLQLLYNSEQTKGPLRFVALTNVRRRKARSS